MADPKVTVQIDGKDNLSPKLSAVGQNIKQIGNQFSELGGKMTAVFTAPIVGMGIAITSFGAESAKAVQDAAGDLSKLSPEVIRAADAYTKMQTALVPVNQALNDAKATMLEALVPVMIQLTPLIVDLANGIKSMVQSFMALPIETQNNIVAFVGLVVAAGPALFMIGQIVSIVGGLVDLFIKAGPLMAGFTTFIKAVGIAFAGVTAPVWGLIAAIGALVALIINGDAMRAWTTLQQLFLIAAYKTGLSGDSFVSQAAGMGLTGNKAGGGRVSSFGSYLVGERGPEILNMGASGGSITPNHQLSRGGGGVTIIYGPTISTASTDEIERLGKFIEQAQRRRP
jgi:hypothetical protein